MRRSLLSTTILSALALGAAYGCADFRDGPLGDGTVESGGSSGDGAGNGGGSSLSSGNGGGAGSAGRAGAGRGGTGASGGTGGSAGAGEAGASGTAGASAGQGSGGAGAHGQGGASGKGGAGGRGGAAGNPSGGRSGGGTGGSAGGLTCNDGNPASVELCGGADDATDENCDGLKTCTGTTEHAVLLGDHYVGSRLVVRTSESGVPYALGEYFAPTRFAGVDLPTGGEQGDIFYGKLDPAGGDAAWMKVIKGHGWQTPQDMVVHAATGVADELTIAGFFTTTETETFKIGDTELASFNVGYGYGFIARFDANGDPLWANQISPASDATSFEEPFAGFRLAERPDGGVYLWAVTPGDISFTHAGTTVYPFTDSFGDDPRGTEASMFWVLSIDPDGNLEHTWSGGWSWAGQSTADDIVLDAAGNVWVAGQATDYFDFGNPGSQNVDGGAYVLRLSVDDSGEVEPDRTANLAGGGPPRMAASKDGSVYAAGSYSGTGSPPWQFWFTSINSSVGFVDSQYLGGASGISEATGIAVDPAGYFTVAGACTGAIDFAPDVAGGEHNTSGTDLCVAKYAPNGTLFWSKVFGDAASQSARSLAVDKLGNLYLLGRVEGTIDLGKGVLTASGVNVLYAQLAP